MILSGRAHLFIDLCERVTSEPEPVADRLEYHCVIGAEILPEVDGLAGFACMGRSLEFLELALVEFLEINENRSTFPFIFPFFIVGSGGT
jgi:hypothetical protein